LQLHLLPEHLESLRVVRDLRHAIQVQRKQPS
jgi:hypothetical protein